MNIIDLTPEFENLYFCCLEDWSDEIIEAVNHKECWYNRMKDKGLRVKLAQDDNGKIGGMIQYIPAELSFIEGPDLYFVLCIWVPGYKKGAGNFQKKGMGEALLKAAEDDVKNLGAKGLAVWGIVLPFFMKASWYKKNGYKVADKDGIMRLLWKSLSPEAQPPEFLKKKKVPEFTPGKVNISLFLNGWCPAQNMTYERTKRALADFKEKIDLKEYLTIDKEVQREWGMSDAVFINKKQIRTGPPLSFRTIYAKIEKKARLIR